MSKKILKQLELALTKSKHGQQEEAAAICQQVLKADPRNAEARALLGMIALSGARFTMAKDLLESSLSIQPVNAGALFNLGQVWLHLGDFEKALYCFDATLKIEPAHYEALRNLANLLTQQGNVTAAIEALKKAIRLKPNIAGNYMLLGNASMDSGQITHAVEYYEKALELDGSLVSARSNLLLCYNYKVQPDLPTQFAVFTEQANEISKNAPRVPVRKLNSGQNKIRVGYVSSDFHSHSVAYFFAPLLRHHERSEFETYAYYNNHRQDNFTRRFMSEFDHWRNIFSLNDEAVLKQIQDDEIDILVDMTGHMRGNRLSLFAAKPCQVQVSWLGYPNTTALQQMDYRFVDSISDPEGLSDDYYTERLIRLPHGFLCYEGAEKLALSPSLPCSAGMPFTFGSFNNLPKITPQVVIVWSSILNQVPGSRIAIKTRQLADPVVRNSLLSMFSAKGIDATRVVFLPAMKEQSDHMEMYHRVDLALDTFPYNGTTTTCEALWMGVPTVCYKGEVHAARVSASIMHHAGLDDFVADDEESYIECAVAWANNKAGLGHLREGMRERLARSDLCNGDQFAKQVETAYKAFLA